MGNSKGPLCCQNLSPHQGSLKPSIGHAKLGDHGPSHALHLLQISPSTSGHLGAAEDQLLRHTATQSSSNPGLAQLARSIGIVLLEG